MNIVSCHLTDKHKRYLEITWTLSCCSSSEFGLDTTYKRMKKVF